MVATPINDDSQTYSSVKTDELVSAAVLASFETRLLAVENRIASLPDANKINLLVFDGSLDKLLAAFVMATGAAATGFEVNMFFTFWGTSALRKSPSNPTGKTWVESAFGWMLPKGPHAAKLSKMDMCGLGRWMMKREMRQKNVADLEKLIVTAAELGVQISVCEMSMKLMGIQRAEIMDYPNLTFCGVASFAELASQANTTLFI